MDPADIFGIEEESAALGAPMDFGMMTQPQGFDMQQYVRPAASPEERSQRESMWSQIVTKFQTDPNLVQAMGLMGAMMMQPIRPGQTAGGSLGNAAVVGMNAYNQAHAAQFEKERALRSEGREERKLGIAEAGAAREAGRETLVREGMQADVEGRRAATSLTRQQISDAVTKAKEHGDLKGLRQLRAQVEEEELRLKQSLPEGMRRDAMLDEMKAARVKLKIAEQELEGLKAKTRLVSAQATKEQQEADMTPQQRAELARSTSRQPTSTEATEAVMRRLHAGSPELQKKYPDVNAMIHSALTGKKGGDTLAEQIETVKGAYGEFPEDWPKEIRQSIQRQVEASFAPKQQPQQQPQQGGQQKPTRDTVSMAEVQETAQKRGLTVDQVIEVLKKRGIKVIDTNAPLPNPRQAR